MCESLTLSFSGQGDGLWNHSNDETRLRLESQSKHVSLISAKHLDMYKFNIFFVYKFHLHILVYNDRQSNENNM